MRKTNSFMAKCPEKVTVICPIRNEEKYISKCLDSLLRQTIPQRDYEILVVDGMSDDRTRDIVKSVIDRNSRIRLLDNKNGYVPFALNVGLQNAIGDVIIRVDGHAIVASDYIEKCLEYLFKTGADCVGGKIESINETLAGEAIALAMSSKFGVGNSRFRTSTKEGYVDTLAFGAYKRKVFDKIGNFDEKFIRNQDDEFNYRLRKNGGKIYLTPKIKSWYYPRANFKKLWRQYFGYGFYKVLVLQKHPKMMQFRQFVPAGFILAIISSTMLACANKVFLYVLFALLSIYILAAFFMSVRLSVKKNSSLIPKIFLSFVILHFSYGFGFLMGFIKHFPDLFKKHKVWLS